MRLHINVKTGLHSPVAWPMGRVALLLLLASTGSCASSAMAQPESPPVGQADQSLVGAPLLSQTSQPSNPAAEKEKAPGIKKTYHFVAFGDYQAGDSVIMKNLKDQAGTPAPDFYVNTGDIATLGLFNGKFPYGPLYPAKGNNDGQIWSSIYPLSKPIKNYYSVNLNNSHFVFLDTDPNNVAKLFPPKSTVLDCKKPNLSQTDWLACDLQQANNNASIDNIFVLLHVPPFSFGGYGSDATELKALEPIFKATPKLRAVLSGHNHFYQRLQRAGVNYLVIGGAGAGLYSLPATTPPEIKKQAQKYHFVVFSVDGTKVGLNTIGYDQKSNKFASIEQIDLSCKNGETRKQPCSLTGSMRTDTCRNASWVIGKCVQAPCPKGLTCCEVDPELNKCLKCIKKGLPCP